MVTVVAVLLAVAATVPLVIDEGPRWYYHIDFDVYRKGGEAFLAGDNLYTRDYAVEGINLPFTYPPLAAILFAPLAWIPFALGALVLTVATVLALWWCLVIVARHVLPAWAVADHRVLATWILPVALLAEPVRETLSYGQVNVLLMTMVLVDTLTRRPWLPRGVFIGLAAAIKLTPAVFVLVFVVRRQWREAATTVASGIGFTLLAAVISPTNSLTYWLDTLSDPSRIGGLAYTSNQSIRGVLTRFTEPGTEGSGLPWLLLVALTLAAIITALVFIDRAAARTGGSPTAGIVLVTSLVALLCSPVSWSHHWTWLALFAFFFAARAWQVAPGACRRTAGVLAAGISFVALTGPHCLLPNQEDREHDWSLWAQPVGNAYVLLAVLILVTALVMPRLLVTSDHAAAERPSTGARLWSWVPPVILAPMLVAVPFYAFS